MATWNLYVTKKFRKLPRIFFEICRAADFQYTTHWRQRYRPSLFLTLKKYFGVGFINIEICLSQNFSFTSLTVLKKNIFEKFNFHMRVFHTISFKTILLSLTDFSKELHCSWICIQCPCNWVEVRCVENITGDNYIKSSKHREIIETSKIKYDYKPKIRNILHLT